MVINQITDQEQRPLKVILGDLCSTMDTKQAN